MGAMKDFTVLDLLDLDVKDNGVLKLRVLAGRAGLSRIIRTPLLSRPGLPLSGFFMNFNSCTIQLFGKGEQAYIRKLLEDCLLYTSPSPRDLRLSRMPSSA